MKDQTSKLVEHPYFNRKGIMTATNELVEEKLRAIATAKAYDDFDNSHGFGLYHTTEATQKAEIDRAYVKVKKWFDKLYPVFEATVTDNQKEK
jgi:hypothetical protein